MPSAGGRTSKLETNAIGIPTGKSHRLTVNREQCVSDQCVSGQWTVSRVSFDRLPLRLEGHLKC